MDKILDTIELDGTVIAFGVATAFAAATVVTCVVLLAWALGS